MKKETSGLISDGTYHYVQQVNKQFSIWQQYLVCIILKHLIKKHGGEGSYLQNFLRFKEGHLYSYFSYWFDSKLPHHARLAQGLRALHLQCRGRKVNAGSIPAASTNAEVAKLAIRTGLRSQRLNS